MISTQYAMEVRLKRDDVPSFDAYPFSLSAVRGLDVLPLHPRVTFFVGENGSGTSTLLEAIAVSCGFNAEGGTKNFRLHAPLALSGDDGRDDDLGTLGQHAPGWFDQSR
jgi:predicted ATPase